MSAEDAPFAWTGRGTLRSGTPYVVAEEALRDRHVLYIGATVALGMWIVAIFNAVGILSIQLRAGEGLRWNPTVDFFVLGLLALLGPYGVASAIRFHRVEGLESRLPDFLRDVAESGRFGRTLPEAITVAATGHYGPLTPEIRKMAAQIEWGVPVSTALERFALRVPTPIVRKAVAILIRAHAAGGNYGDVLTRVAHDTWTEQLAVERRRASMLTYVAIVYLAFGVFLVTIYVLAAVFLPQMLTANPGAFGAVYSGLGITAPLVATLSLALLVAVIVHAVGDGMVAGILYRGHPVDGFLNVTILLAIGWTVMRFVVPIVGGAG